jgi:hypothetical protein
MRNDKIRVSALVEDCDRIVSDIDDRLRIMKLCLTTVRSLIFKFSGQK